MLDGPVLHRALKRAIGGGDISKEPGTRVLISKGSTLISSPSMGNNQSHQLSAPVAQTTFSEKVTNVADAFESVHLDDASQAISEDGSLTQENLKHWESEASKVRYKYFRCSLPAYEIYHLKDPRLSLARTILNHNEISSALLSRNASIADTHVFNTQVDFVTGPTTDQKSSGRCWLFASTNVIRYSIMKKLGLKEFELSQVSVLLF
jgi:bleomycin hydrolase